MAIELITGRAGKAHIGSEDDRAYHAYTNGEGRYILNGGTANIESANNVHIDPVEFLVDGAHVRVTGAGEDVAIENGVASYKRIDVIALHYTRTGNENNYIESVEFAVVKGANVELGSEPQAPDMPKSGTILTGADDVYVPVYSLLIDGLTPKNLTTLLEEYALPVAHGGTGAKNVQNIIKTLFQKNFGSSGFPNTTFIGGFGSDFNDGGHMTLAQLRVKMGLNESGAVPSANAVPWGGVTGKPSAFAPSAHKHGAGDITSGTLPTSRGGTGSGNIDAARGNLGVCKRLWAGTHSSGSINVGNSSKYNQFCFIVSNGHLVLAAFGSRKSDSAINAQTVYFDGTKKQYTIWAGATVTGDKFNNCFSQALEIATVGWGVALTNWQIKEIWGIG